MTAIGRRFLGWLGVVLGAIGVVACVAGLAGVWVLHAKIQRPLNEVADALAGLGTDVQAQADDFTDGIQTARDAVDEMDQRVAQWAQDLLHLSSEDLEGLAALHAQVQGIVQRLRAWADLARTSMDFVEQVIGMVESSVGFIQADRGAREALRVAVANGRQEVEVAAGLLDEVADRLENLRSGQALPGNADALQSLAERIDTSLAHVQGHVQAFAAGVGGLRDGIVILQKRIRRVLVITAVILSLLLLWLAAAQTSLAVHGWGWTRGRAIDGH